MRALSKPSLLILALVLGAVGGPGCGTDDGPKTYRVFITANPNVLTHEGSANSTISVRVLDQDDSPADSGMRILLQALDASFNPTGRFGETGDATETAFLDTSGSAQSSFTCTSEGLVLLRATLQSGEAGVAQVDCQVLFEGDWTIELRAERRAIPFDDNTQVHAEVRDSRGGAVPQGVGVLLELVGGPGGFTPDGLREVRVSTAPDGVASVEFVSGTQRGEAQIEASFSNPSIGSDTAAMTIQIDPDVPTEPTLVMSTSRTAVLADGETVLDGVVTVLAAGAQIVPDADVTLTVDRGNVRKEESGSFGPEVTSRTDSDGDAVFQYRAGTDPGRATISACVDVAEFDPPPETSDTQVCQTYTVRLLSVGSISSRDVEDVPLGVRGSGQNESTSLCFAVKDTVEEPFPEGIVVQFNVQTTSAGGDVLATNELTDSNGHVCTTVTSGSTFGVISVEPCVEVGRATVCGDPVDIPVTGATATRAGMSLACDHVNLGALRYLQGTTITQPPTGELCTTCRMTLRDRFGNPVGFPQTVTFAAEVGSFQPRAQATNNGSGDVTIKYCAESNLPTDVDVSDDIPGEPYWEDEDGVQFNPRDGLVTIIAYVNGEEEFDDANENGLWDEGEVYWDQGEPFIDVDDDNVFDPEVENERHIDISAEGYVTSEYDLPNLQWDSEGFIWVQSHVLLTGSPAFGDFEDGNTDVLLDLDEDYNSGARYSLSHWFVQPNLDVPFNVYESTVPNPNCSAGGEEYCLSASRAGGNFELFFVGRDIFGNPMNESGDLTFGVFGCNGVSIVDANELTPDGDELPFKLEINRRSVRDQRDLIDIADPVELAQPYRVDIGPASGRDTFIAGSSELFDITIPNANDVGSCRFRVQHPMRACPTCNDPLDEAPWPFIVIHR